MKIASTIINGVCVDCGDDLQAQKAAVKQLLTDNGSGSDRAYVLYSSKQPCTRKRIDLSKCEDIQKAYDAAKKKAAKAVGGREKALEQARKERAEMRTAKVKQHKERLERMQPKNKAAKAE